MGGQGNQMFQYAFGRYFAIKNNTSLYLDLSILEDKTPRIDFTIRDYKLDVYNLKAKKISRMQRFICFNRYLRKIRRFFGIGFNEITEHQIGFDKELLKLQGHLFLTGYWQSEKYFSEISQHIREEFKLKEKFKPENQIINKILNTESVSIHIRRGDYVNNATNASIYCECDNVYYEKAINIIERSVHKPLHFYIFSDDAAWVRLNFRLTSPYDIISNENQNQAYQELQLMSLCKHNIIANSSFSWWAAWLNNNPSKIVIAPIKWFRDKDANSKDITPEEWIKI